MNLNNVYEFCDENFVVVNFFGVSCFIDDIDYFFQLVVGDSYINFDFWQEIYVVFCVVIQFGVFFLMVKFFYFGDGQFLNVNGRKCFLYVFQFEWFDNYSNQFYRIFQLELGNGCCCVWIFQDGYCKGCVRSW